MMWDALPDELRCEILRHRAASTIQDRWLRWSLWGHARHPSWDEIRLHLRHHGLWRDAIAYENVRREWRQEPESWMYLDVTVATVLFAELEEGLWGVRSHRFP